MVNVLLYLTLLRSHDAHFQAPTTIVQLGMLHLPETKWQNWTHDILLLCSYKCIYDAPLCPSVVKNHY